MKRILLTGIAVCLMMLTACSAQTGESSATENAAETETAATKAPTEAIGYRQITGDEAQELMKGESDCVILDVRTPEEFAEGHIPGAICISYDSIPTDTIAELPDKDQLILVYCRSGRRSKIAAEQLVRQGYTNIVEFGGILDWTGEITTE